MVKYFENLFFPNVYIGAAFSEKDYAAELKRLGIKEQAIFANKAASMNCITKNDGIGEIYIICFDPIKHKKLHKNQIAALICHEAVHISDYLFRHIGEDKPGDEIRAYLVQYIVQNALYAMDSFLKKK